MLVQLLNQHLNKQLFLYSYTFFSTFCQLLFPNFQNCCISMPQPRNFIFQASKELILHALLRQHAVTSFTDFFEMVAAITTLDNCTSSIMHPFLIKYSPLLQFFVINTPKPSSIPLSYRRKRTILPHFSLTKERVYSHITEGKFQGQKYGACFKMNKESIDNISTYNNKTKKMEM